MTGRVQTVRLECNLGYKEKELEFNALLLCMLNAPAGSDGCIRYRLDKSGNSYNLKRISSGINISLTETGKRGNNEESNLVISSGTYNFEEYPELSEENILMETLSDILGTRGKDEIYIRIYKKNSIECVMQAFRPL